MRKGVFFCAFFFEILELVLCVKKGLLVPVSHQNINFCTEALPLENRILTK